MEKQVNWEAGRRASPNVLVGSDRRNLKICFGTEIFCGRRSTVRVWWTFPVTLVSILGHDAKKISLLSPGTANKSINCSHQPSLWKTVLLSCTSYNLDALYPPPPSFIIPEGILSFFSPIRWACMYKAPTVCQACKSRQVCEAAPALPVLIDRGWYTPVDAWMLSTARGSLREQEHIQSLIVLPSRRLPELSRRVGGLIS